MGSGSDLVISFYLMSTGCNRSDLEMDRSNSLLGECTCAKREMDRHLGQRRLDLVSEHLACGSRMGCGGNRTTVGMRFE